MNKTILLRHFRLKKDQKYNLKTLKNFQIWSKFEFSDKKDMEIFKNLYLFGQTARRRYNTQGK